MAESKKKKGFTKPWMKLSSPNNLASVHSLHVKDSKVELDKSVRNVFVEGSVEEIVGDFQVIQKDGGWAGVLVGMTEQMCVLPVPWLCVCVCLSVCELVIDSPIFSKI